MSETEISHQWCEEAQNSQEGVHRRIGWKPKVKDGTAEHQRMAYRNTKREDSRIAETPYAENGTYGVVGGRG